MRQKLERRITRFEFKVLLTNYWVPIARHEDVWDSILEQDHGIGSGDEEANATKGKRESNWVDVMNNAHRENMKLYETDLATDRALARKMQTIVDKETALALKEGQDVTRGRRKRQRAA